MCFIVISITIEHRIPNLFVQMISISNSSLYYKRDLVYLAFNMINAMVLYYVSTCLNKYVNRPATIQERH